MLFPQNNFNIKWQKNLWLSGTLLCLTAFRMQAPVSVKLYSTSSRILKLILLIFSRLLWFLVCALPCLLRFRQVWRVLLSALMRFLLSRCVECLWHTLLCSSHSHVHKVCHAQQIRDQGRTTERFPTITEKLET